MSLSFPEKVTFGARKPAVVTQRRLLLQTFLQGVVDLSATDFRSQLNKSFSKEALLLALPFFGEDTIVMAAMGSLDDNNVLSYYPTPSMVLHIPSLVSPTALLGIVASPS